MLKVEGLNISLKENKNKYLIKNFNFELKRGEVLSILGESGSGKSLTVKGIMGLLERDIFEVTGKVIYEGENLLELSYEKIRKIRGKKIAMILQNPMNSFDPLYTVGYQIEETLREHLSIGKRELKGRSLEMLDKMCIKNGRDVLRKYPHQLSGGMLQRIMIGIALLLEPDIIIADEPTTALDSITQYEIIEEFIKIKDKKNIGIIFITHDIGVASKISDKIIVIEKGMIKINRNKDDVLKDNNVDIIQKKLILLNRYKEVLKNC